MRIQKLSIQVINSLNDRLVRLVNPRTGIAVTTVYLPPPLVLFFRLFLTRLLHMRIHRAVSLAGTKVSQQRRYQKCPDWLCRRIDGAYLSMPRKLVYDSVQQTFILMSVLLALPKRGRSALTGRRRRCLARRSPVTLRSMRTKLPCFGLFVQKQVAMVSLILLALSPLGGMLGLFLNIQAGIEAGKPHRSRSLWLRHTKQLELKPKPTQKTDNRPYVEQGGCSIRDEELSKHLAALLEALRGPAKHRRSKKKS
jgi:hypothetical protein